MRTCHTKLSTFVPVAMVQSPVSDVLSFMLRIHDRTAPVVFRGAVPFR